MGNIGTELMYEQDVDDPDEGERRQKHIDFKMVTFSLGGKDYGIDIMRVKEIAKFAQFTYVPNTAPFVRGVYNLRGDIISVIDLRLMFNLPADEHEEGKPENGLILRLESNMIGVVVDQIDKVVGISSSQVQPPHPIFGDINVKFISGVVEHDERLYIILDVDRIFTRESDEQEPAAQQTYETPEPEFDQATPATPSSQTEVHDSSEIAEDKEAEQGFIVEGLATYLNFHVTDVNHEWFEARFEEWRTRRTSEGKDVQFTDESDARSFVNPFYSQYTDRFWQKDYTDEVVRLLPEPPSQLIHVWNPGCGAGYESFSIASMLLATFSERQVKVWAGDKDLMKISSAPNITFSRTDIPQEWSEFVVEGKNGLNFAESMKESVLFEFSDVLNTAGMPKMDYIVARDLVSMHSDSEQRKILKTFEEALKPGGALLLGDNERVVDGSAWEEITGETLTVYRRR